MNRLVQDDFIGACVSGCFKAIPALVKAGADVNERDGTGLTPLQRVAASPSSDRDDLHDIAATAQALIEAGADIHARDTAYIGGTALHWCWGVYGAAVAYRLILAGADVNARGLRDGYTPLHAARFSVLASLLLDSGAYLEARDDDGETPLGLALTCRDVDVCRVLINYGARIPSDYARRLSYSGWLQQHGIDGPGASAQERAALEREIEAVLRDNPGRLDETHPAARGRDYRHGGAGMVQSRRRVR